MTRDDREPLADPAAAQGGWRWGVVVASSLGMATNCVSLANYPISLFVGPLHDAYGWSRQEILTASTFVTLGVVVMSLLIGGLADRLPLRRLIILSQIALALIFFAMAGLIQNLTSFYALYLAVPIVSAGTLAITFAKLVSDRFDRERGLALGIMLAGTGLCGVVIPPYLSFFIDQYGWRAGYVALGVLPLATAIFASMLLIPKTPVTGPRLSQAAMAEPEGVTLGEALRDRRFWILAIALFIGGAAGAGVLTNMVPLVMDHGFDRTTAAMAASLFGGAVIAGRIVVGLALDRFWGPPVALAMMLPAGVGAFYLTSAGVTTAGVYAAGFSIGFAMGAEFDLAAYLISRYFGTRSYGKLFGAVYILLALAFGFTAPLFGRSFDVAGSYNPALYFAAGAWIVAGLLLMTLGPYRYPPPSHARARKQAAA